MGRGSWLEMSRKSKDTNHKRRSAIPYIILLCIALLIFALIAIKSRIDETDLSVDQSETTILEEIAEPQKIEVTQAEQQMIGNTPEIEIIDDLDDEAVEEENDIPF